MSKMQYINRDYRPEDFSEIAAFWDETGMGGLFRGDSPEIIDRTLSTGGKLIIAESVSPKIIIGTSWITTDGRRAYLHHFGIKQKFRGQGIAKNLLSESIRFAKERGLQIKLEVHRDNKAAVSLYQNYGFQYLGDYEVYIIRNYDVEKRVI
jgi:ribosomal protein S18 acetylase RimI-like enzyme